ncbi:hypothetical protein CIW52_29950 [Mycolicibacterium sp. P9-64]|uniref:hypothetical protein n=1 Tax=Mycolicibacterium sp. P9-64 TaxID=2024612 RepID=UPI0011EEB8F1|nr:hypothetical protein [Mycolicibacterium sp. P9-64]KAA0078801.1 hypothetical protein CIW52_29950 [Mycolicibacterium sp. P9-64]
MRVQGWRFTWWELLCWLWAVGWVIVAVWLVHDRHWWANTLQVIGSAVTAAGLFGAYVRSKHQESLPEYARWRWTQFSAWVNERWARLLRRPRNVTVHAGAATAGVYGWAPTVVIGHAPFTLDKTKSFEERLAQVAERVNQLTAKQPVIDRRIHALERDVTRIMSDLSAVRSEALAHIQSQINDLDKRLNMTQVLDLRWAIIGLLITVLGIALSY